MLLRALPSLVVAVLHWSDQCSTATTRLGTAHSNINTKHNKYNRHAATNPISLSLVNEVKEKYLFEDGQKLTETFWRILRLLKQYNHFNVLF
jgi:Mlc titration factor MtfA (ptsG expression regulator)